ncbi:hypothetical protein Sango_0443800 [Sesamum angolense]|uniref:Uncharacterized protein n=1 Tax=Sesamum angolense TaxID=2727404 RepID=A0AAE1XC00_9LAMI|nr:hypothetical protein Sango_0443800 [Sesamum angolense]
MAQKRKMEITVVDENERVLFSMFQNTANSLSQFYTQSVTQQKLAFEAGQNYALLKFHEWIVTKLQEGKMVTVPEIFAYLQGKLNGWMPGAGLPEQGGNESDNSSGTQGLAASSSTLINQGQDSYPDMQMEIASDRTID